MKTKRTILCFATLTCLSLLTWAAAADRAESPKAAGEGQAERLHSEPLEDSYRLTVHDILTTKDEQVTQIIIETQNDQPWVVDAGPDREERASMKPGADGRGYWSSMPIVAVRVSPPGAKADLVKTVVVSGSVVRDVPRGKPLDETLALSAKDGVYKLGVPLVVGRIDGREMTLTVGREAQ